MKVYIVWGSWAGDPPMINKIFLNEKSAYDHQDRQIIEDIEGYLDYWVQSVEVSV